MATGGFYILDLDDNPKEVDSITWAKWFQVNQARRIVQQTMLGKYKVSTVFLGVNYNMLDGGDPVLYETMVFNTEGENPHEDLGCWRYTDQTEAREGHERVVEAVEKELQHTPAWKEIVNDYCGTSLPELHRRESEMRSAVLRGIARQRGAQDGDGVCGAEREANSINHRGGVEEQEGGAGQHGAGVPERSEAQHTEDQGMGGVPEQVD